MGIQSGKIIVLQEKHAFKSFFYNKFSKQMEKLFMKPARLDFDTIQSCVNFFLFFVLKIHVLLPFGATFIQLCPF